MTRKTVNIRLCIGVLLVAILMLNVACDSNNRASGIAKTVGREGGTFTSEDGFLTLIIPEGAFSNPETITIKRIEADDLGPEFDEIAEASGVERAYELGPDRLSFQQPVKVRVRSDPVLEETEEGMTFTEEFLVTSVDGKVIPLEDLVTDLDLNDNTATITGELRHFSPLVRVDGLVQVTIGGIPDQSSVGDSFDVAVYVDRIGEGFELDPSPGYEDLSEQPIEAGDNDLEGGDLVRLSWIAPGVYHSSFPYSCTSEGSGNLYARLLISRYIPYDPLNINYIEHLLSGGGSGNRGHSYFLRLNKDVQCVSSTARKPEIQFFSAENLGEGSVKAEGQIRYPTAEEPDLGFLVNWADGTIQEIDEIEAQVEEDLWKTIYFQAFHGYSQPGFYTLELIAENMETGVESSAETEIEVKLNEEAAGVSIDSFNAAVKMAESRAVDAEWEIEFGNVDPTCLIDWGDGVEEQVDCGESSGEDSGIHFGSAEHSYAIDGDFNIILLAQLPEPDLSDTAETNISVKAGLSPSIERLSLEPRAPLRIYFELETTYPGTADTLDGQIDFGDGTVRHLDFDLKDDGLFFTGLEYDYAAAGDYSPTATVEGTGGSDSTSANIKKVVLTVEKDGDGTGAVTGQGDFGFGPLPVIDCGPSCDADKKVFLFSTEFSDGATIVSLTAEPESDSIFEGWGGDAPSDCQGSTSPCTFSMDADRTLTPIFLSADTGPSGLLTGIFNLSLTQPEALHFLGVGASASFGDETFFRKRSRFDSNHRSSRQGERDKVKFGPVEGHVPVAFSGAEGYVVIDLMTNEILLEEIALVETGPFLGVTAASQQPSGPDSPAMLLAFGTNGYVLDRFDRFGPLALSGVTFDAFPAGGDVIADFVPFVRPNAGVEFVAFDPSSGIYVTIDDQFDDSLFDGPPVSAYVHEIQRQGLRPNGAYLVLVGGEKSGIYLATMTPEEQSATRIADMGNDARKVRCVEDDSPSGNLVCAVSVFGDNQLSLLNWDGATAPTTAGVVDVGDGPVGIDLQRLSNGNIGIVSTGFNDNTITEIEAKHDGSVVNSRTYAAPEGCQSPGHAIYVQDAEGVKVVGTCYDSKAYFIIESRIAGAT